MVADSEKDPKTCDLDHTKKSPAAKKTLNIFFAPRGRPFFGPDAAMWCGAQNRTSGTPYHGLNSWCEKTTKR